MEEKYSEYAVSVQQTPMMWIKRAVAVLLTLVLLFLAFTVYWLFFLPAAAGIVGCYFAYLTMELEYEAIYLDGTLEISAIYRKMRRKKKFQCEMKSVSGYYIGQKEDAVRLGKITRDYSSHREGSICCVLKADTPKGVHVVCFEPGEEMAALLERYHRTLKV